MEIDPNKIRPVDVPIIEADITKLNAATGGNRRFRWSRRFRRHWITGGREYRVMEEIERMEKMFSSEGVTKSDRMLHTPGMFAKNHLLYVQEVGRLESLVPHVCRRENLDSYLIFEVVAGKGSISTEGQTIELHKGECVWIDCHKTFEHVSSEDEPWKLAWVHFNGNCAAEFYELFHKKSRCLSLRRARKRMSQS